MDHPQLSLIPPAMAMLAAKQIDRRRLRSAPWTDGPRAQPSNPPASRRPSSLRAGSPLQFRLDSLSALGAVVALVFGLLRCAGVSARAAAVVLVVLVVGAVAGRGLMAAIFRLANQRPTR